MGYESRKGLLVMSKKEIEEALTKKLEKLLEKEKISEKDLNEINRIKENIFYDKASLINKSSAINMYILLVKSINYIEKLFNKSHIDYKSVKQEFLNTYLEARGYYCKVKDFDDIFCNHILLVSFLTIMAVLLEYHDNIELNILANISLLISVVFTPFTFSLFNSRHFLMILFSM